MAVNLTEIMAQREAQAAVAAEKNKEHEFAHAQFALNVVQFYYKVRDNNDIPIPRDERITSDGHNVARQYERLLLAWGNKYEPKPE